MAAIKIDGAGYPIKDIFSDQFSFKIPNYQRPYAWKTEETERLLDDLLDAMEDDKIHISDVPPYFLGNIVLIKPIDKPELEVVDGQQRLTTLTILFAVLRKLLPAYQHFLNQLICQPENCLTGNSARPRLYLRESDRDFFEKHIQISDKIENIDKIPINNLSDSQKNIIKNTQILLQRIAKELPEEYQKTRLTQFLLQRCYLVAVSTPDFDCAYRIFSVLNDRGLDLSITDILKADIIGAISKQAQSQKTENKYTQKWEELEANLGRDAFKELFSHIRMIYRKSKLSRKVVEEFREYILTEVNNPCNFIDDVLSPFNNAFYDIKNCIFNGDKYSQEINQLFKWLHRIDHADWIPPAILYLKKYYNYPEKLLKFFSDLERLTSGLMILRKNINERIKRYADILKDIEQDGDLYCSDSPLQLSSSEQQEIIKSLKGNLYEMAKVNLYVLLRLDSLISDGIPNYDTKITIEHVLPQNPKPHSKWMTDFSSKEIRDKYVHRLGNLVLLSRKKNCEAQNFDFEVKKTNYFNKSITTFALTIKVLQEKKWTPDIIEKRQEYLLKQLQELWRLKP